MAGRVGSTKQQVIQPQAGDGGDFAQGVASFRCCVRSCCRRCAKACRADARVCGYTG